MGQKPEKSMKIFDATEVSARGVLKTWERVPSLEVTLPGPWVMGARPRAPAIVKPSPGDVQFNSKPGFLDTCPREGWGPQPSRTARWVAKQKQCAHGLQGSREAG